MTTPFDGSGLGSVPSTQLAKDLYGACMTGDLTRAAVIAAVLSYRTEGAKEVVTVFHRHCSASGRERVLPEVSR